jgi:hypothetical protein
MPSSGRKQKINLNMSHYMAQYVKSVLIHVGILQGILNKLTILNIFDNLIYCLILINYNFGNEFPEIY